jgi:ribosomal protein L5
VNGVAHLVNNKWSNEVTYRLDTVKTKDNGYAFKVG